MANPTERAAGPNPEAGGDDEPKDAGEETSVIELSYARNKKAEQRCELRVSHDQLCLRVSCPTDSLIPQSAMYKKAYAKSYETKVTFV